MSDDQLQFLSNENGDVTGVLVPIDQWREISSELETRHLLNSKAMKERLLAARSRSSGTSMEEITSQLGLEDADA